MDFLVRFTSLFALGAALAFNAPVAAHDDEADGYGGSTGYGFDVSHDGYQREGQTGVTPDATTYVVIEAEDGTTEQVDGETVIVVQEPEPVAATAHAPPAPQTVVVVQPEVQCPGAIWVDGYWNYSNGEYLWVDGHCVVERVNYVFVQPRWDFYASTWWFVPGYYRPWGVYVGFGYYRPWHWFPPYHHPYYRTRHPVPVYRSAPRRPTRVHARPSGARPTRGVVRRPGYDGRPGRTPTRTGTVTRAPTTRSSSVTRTRPSTSRVDSVNRARTTPARTMVVHRPPTSSARTRAVGRPASGSTLTSSVSRSKPSNAVRAQPRATPSRTSSVRRPASSTSARASVNRPSSGRQSSSPNHGHANRRPSSGSSRGSSVSRPSSSRSRPSMGSSRPSLGGSRSSMGRGGGFGRSSSGGFGGARSVPTARGR